MRRLEINHYALNLSNTFIEDIEKLRKFYGKGATLLYVTPLVSLPLNYKN